MAFSRVLRSSSLRAVESAANLTSAIGIPAVAVAAGRPSSRSPRALEPERAAMEDVAWRAGRSLGSAQASDMAAVGTTGLAPDLAQSAPLVLRGVTPSAEARAARRICETPV